jgi:hypothetical protein
MGGDLTTLTEIVREKRLWYPRPQFSGQADFVGFKTQEARKDGDGMPVMETTALIVDYKTGRNTVDKAEANLQLRGLAALLWANRDVDVVYAAIIQPYASPQTTIVRYDAVDLSTAAGEVAEIVAKAYTEGVQRTPGEYQCRYCRARATIKCPESVGTLVPFAEKTPVVLSATLLDRCAMAEKVIESIREAAKRALEADPNAIPGWKLKPGVERETINDPDRVYQRCLSLKMDHPAFMKTVEVKKGKLKDAIRESSGLKGKALDAAVATVLDGCVEKKQTAPSLARDE